jgi:integrase
MPSGSVIEYAGKRGVVWRIKWTDAAGLQVQETIGAERDGVTRKVAEVELRERLTRVAKKGYQRPKPITFAAYSQTWFEECQTRRSWSPRTVAAYRNALSRLSPTFDRLPLASIRPRDISVYVQQQLETHAAATVTTDISLLGDIFKTAKREELIDSNPAEGVERPKIGRRRWRILEPVEVRRVLAAFTDERARTVFMTLALTGVRRVEITSLRWRDVDLVDNVLHVRVSKTEQGERTIALVPALAEALWQHRRGTPYQGDDEFVFASSTGKRLGADWYAQQFRKALKAAGITDYVRPFHDARHGALTNMAATSPSPIALMATAGHRNMATTNRYLHLAGVVFRAEAEALAARYNFVLTSENVSEPETAEGVETSALTPR